MSPSIRVSLKYEEAEALLDQENAEPRLRLRARAKLISPLLADRNYIPPAYRAKDVGVNESASALALDEVTPDGIDRPVRDSQAFTRAASVPPPGEPRE